MLRFAYSKTNHLSTDRQFLTAGVRAMFMSTLSFALANVFVKQVSHIPAMEVVFFRCVLAATFCLIGLHRAGADWKGSNHSLLLMRGIFGTTALYLFFVTVQNIPLASAMTIQYLSPIFTTIIAVFVLKEGVKKLQWVFYAVAFGGVLLIERFDPRISLFFLTLGIISAFCSGVAYNLVRSMKGKEHPLTVVLHFQLVGILAGTVSLFFDFRMPTGWDWLWLFLIGVFSQLGQMFLTNALQREAVAGVAIVNYTGLVYGVAIGWIIFGEVQGGWAFVGMGLVIIGVAASVLYTKRVQRLAATHMTEA
jgi:drug/metabolite transporter (DMT)-like permease